MDKQYLFYSVRFKWLFSYKNKLCWPVFAGILKLVLYANVLKIMVVVHNYLVIKSDIHRYIADKKKKSEKY